MFEKNEVHSGALLSPAHLPAVDFLRLFSILLVMGGHYPIVAPIFRNGTYGVTVFFVISGYVITRRLLRESPDLKAFSIREFYLQRVARLLPLYLLIVLLGVYFTFVNFSPTPPYGIAFRNGPIRWIPLFGLSLLTSTFNWFMIIFGVGGLGLHWRVLWTLSVEGQFYLIYPFLLKHLGRHDRVVRMLVIALISGVLFRIGVCYWAPSCFMLSFFSTFAALDALSLGALTSFYHASCPVPAGKGLRQVRILGVLGLLLIVATCLTTNLFNAYQRTWSLSLVAVGAALFLLAAPSLPLFHTFVGRVTARLGKYSYGSYLYHPLVLFAGGNISAGSTLRSPVRYISSPPCSWREFPSSFSNIR